MLREKFMNVPEEYSIAPFWFWNDDLKLENLKWQMKEMYEKGVHEVVISSRLGIQIEYLSEKWFDRIEVVVKYAEQLGMKIWLYDEDNWPSGYAGGKVLEEDPDCCGKHLKRIEVVVKENNWKQAIKLPIVKAFQKREREIWEIDLEKEQAELGSTLILFCQDYTLWHPAYSQGYYTDMLNRKATDLFIKYTHQIYKERVGEYFGSVIKGFFVDEPGFYNNLHLVDIGDDETIPWTDSFPDYFREMNGYDITSLLPHLWEEIDEQTKKIRIDYYETLCDMYKESYLDVLRKFCEENHMQLIGHLHYEEFLHYHITTQGNYMKALGSLSIVGLDRIDTNPEKIAEKYTSSVAHTQGKKRVMSETYALSGWELTLQEMKRWVDYQYVRGVNMLIPHAFYCSIEGERSRECPPSEFYQNPYWKYFQYYSEYVKRASYILSQGEHRCHIALYYPIHSMQAEYSPSSYQGIIQKDREFQKLALGLLEYQMDFDVITKPNLLQGIILDNGRLKIAEEDYGTLIFSMCDYFEPDEINKVQEFLKQGGKVIFANGLPIQFFNLQGKDNVFVVKSGQVDKSYTFEREILPIQRFLMEANQIDIYLPKRDGTIKYMHRVIDDKNYYFITNEENCQKKIRIYIDGAHKIERWNLENGKIENLSGTIKRFPKIYLGVTRNGGECVADIEKTFTECQLELPEYGSALLCLEQGKIEVQKTKEQEIRIPLHGKWDIIIDEKKWITDTLCLENTGEHYFSGTLQAQTHFKIPDTLEWKKVYWTADEVKDIVEVDVNGISCGTRIFAPYEIDITDAVCYGDNIITLQLTNTLLSQLRMVPGQCGIYGETGIKIKR